MDFTALETILLVMLFALLVTIIFRSLRLPVILGYITVGAFVGPHFLAWLPNTENIKELAECGIALLMFTIGLDFSLKRLFALRFSVFILGGLQVVLTILITLLIALLLKMTLLQSLVVAFVVSMSSTTLVIKQLSEQSELKTEYGLNAVGILLFQDLAVIPILVILASLYVSSNEHFAITLFVAFLKGLLAIASILFSGRYLLRPLFHIIKKTQMPELFTLSVLVVSIGAAWVSHTLGVSYAFGAFLAGIMLAETEYKQQIKDEIRPFKDVLLGVFFVSIGMLVNLQQWMATYQWIALLLLAIMIGKTLLIATIIRGLKESTQSAAKTAIILSQGGEFGFAILSLALSKQLLPHDYGQVVLASLLISFSLAPIIIRHHNAIVDFLFPPRS